MRLGRLDGLQDAGADGPPRRPPTARARSAPPPPPVVVPTTARRPTRARSTWPHPRSSRPSPSCPATRAAIRRWNPEPLAGNYNECAQLSAVIVKANTNAENPNTRAVLFHLGKFIPTGVPDTYGFNGIDDTSATTGDTVALRYSGGIAGLDSVVKFRWNGNGVELIGNTRLAFARECGVVSRWSARAACVKPTLGSDAARSSHEMRASSRI